MRNIEKEKELLEQIKNKRKELGMSQSQFSKFLDVSIQTIHALDQGISCPGEWVGKLILFRLNNDKQYHKEFGWHNISILCCIA